MNTRPTQKNGRRRTEQYVEHIFQVERRSRLPAPDQREGRRVSIYSVAADLVLRNAG